MSLKVLIDCILASARDAGVKLRLNKGRNLVTRLIFGRPYSPVMAAFADGKLGLPALADERTRELRATHGGIVDVVAQLVPNLLEEHPVMSATHAIRSNILPPPLQVTEADIAALGGRPVRVPLGPNDVDHGNHLRFFVVNGERYAFEDLAYANGDAYLTVEQAGVVVRRGSSHYFLSHKFEKGAWRLEWSEHRLAMARHRDLTYVELADAI